jgi:hypothetical protein
MRPSTSSKLMMSCQQCVSIYAFDCWKLCKCASMRRILEINLLALTLFGSCEFRATSRFCKRSWTRRGDSTSRAMTGRGSRISGRSSSWSRLVVPHKRMHVHPFIILSMIESAGDQAHGADWWHSALVDICASIYILRDQNDGCMFRAP